MDSVLASLTVGDTANFLHGVAMLDLSLGRSRDETIFAIAAISILASGVPGIDKLVFQPKQRPVALQPARKHRLSYVVEEIVEQDVKRPTAKSHRA